MTRDSNADRGTVGRIGRRTLVQTLGVAAVAAGATASAAAEERGSQPLAVAVECGDDGGRVTVENTGGVPAEVRDIDDEGVDALDGRPVVEPGRALVLEAVPDGTVTLQAFDPDAGTPVAPAVSVEVDCPDEPACTLPPCIHPELGFTDVDDAVGALGVEPALEVSMPVEEPSRRPGDPEPDLDFLFDPMGFQVAPGDAVSFLFSTPEHSVTAYHPAQGRQRRIPEGLPPFTSPVLPAGRRWVYQFDQPGVYDLLCAPHEVFGMVARVVVAEEGTVPELDVSEGGRPPAGFAGAVLDDPMMTPENVVENGSVAWDDLAVIAGSGGGGGGGGGGGEEGGSA
jgi:plastocyanin